MTTTTKIMKNPITKNISMGDNVTMEDDKGHDADPNSSLHMFRLAVHVIVCLLGTTGNGLVIWFCIFRMRKTVNMLWIVNLAIADFLFTFLLPLRITYLALDNHWPFGQLMCKSFWFVNYLNLSVSVLQLMVISIDRCICVYFPVWCKNYRRIRLAKIITAIIWIISVLFNIPYFFFESAFSEKGKIYCRNSGAKYFKWMVVVRFFCLFIVPFSIIIVCYTAITVRVKRKGFMLSSRSFKMFLVIIISFFICFFPYNLFLLLELFGPSSISTVNRTVKLTFMCLMIANSCINPILYILIGRDFIQKLCTSFQSVFEKVFTDDGGRRDSTEQSRGSSVRFSKPTPQNGLGSSFS